MLPLLLTTISCDNPRSGFTTRTPKQTMTCGHSVQSIVCTKKRTVATLFVTLHKVSGAMKVSPDGITVLRFPTNNCCKHFAALFARLCEHRNDANVENAQNFWINSIRSGFEKIWNTHFISSRNRDRFSFLLTKRLFFTPLVPRFVFGSVKTLTCLKSLCLNRIYVNLQWIRNLNSNNNKSRFVSL